MARQRTISGELVQYEHPDWTPLETVLGTELASDFMWMHEIELADQTRVHAHKHRDTRRYVHLTSDARTYLYTSSGRYRRIPLYEAKTLALHAWGGLRHDPWTPDVD
jgi:hypothetical protein